MYDTELVRSISRQICEETDPDKTDELLQLLKAVIHNDFEEVRTRMEFLHQKYALMTGNRDAAHFFKPETHD
jgi:hypothetical protein